ncbi:uncharacterized protein LOC555981 [Danio rerio]|uniref:Uncharacterized protein LOC555981 n=1 Tax=Danio rerio TaxID=7955 RepID=F1QVN1_DANRE|nr:uncharacterized protein LOC555981 isoform X1 [Danio rerio]|eukprot:XP_005155712.1 uncharacterized protein LOC555981 isoform X1 [Danio rerio]
MDQKIQFQQPNPVTCDAEDMYKYPQKPPPHRMPKGTLDSVMGVVERSAVFTRQRDIRLPPIPGISHHLGPPPEVHPSLDAQTQTDIYKRMRRTIRATLSDKAKKILQSRCEQQKKSSMGVRKKATVSSRPKTVKLPPSSAPPVSVPPEPVPLTPVPPGPSTATGLPPHPAAQMSETAVDRSLDTGKDLPVVESSKKKRNRPPKASRRDEDMGFELMVISEMWWEIADEIREIEAKKENIVKKANCLEKRFHASVRLIAEQQEEERDLKQIWQSKNSGCQIPVWRMKNEQVAEAIAEIHESFGEISCPSIPYIMQEDIDQWCSDASRFVRNTRLQKTIQSGFHHIEYSKRQQKNAERQARRRQIRHEIALAPPVKITGRKLIPRSQPPKVVEKVVKVKEEKNLLYFLNN